MTTTKKQRIEVIRRLSDIGIGSQDANALRRISMTLHNWFELECGTERGCIERDEETGKPFMTYEAGAGPRKRYPVPDREAGAMKRLAVIAARYSDWLVPYVQGDCRGAALYILRKSDIRDGESIDSIYNRGVAVY